MSAPRGLVLACLLVATSRAIAHERTAGAVHAVSDVDAPHALVFVENGRCIALDEFASRAECRLSWAWVGNEVAFACLPAPVSPDRCSDVQPGQALLREELTPCAPGLGVFLAGMVAEVNNDAVGRGLLATLATGRSVCNLPPASHGELRAELARAAAQVPKGEDTSE